jgi:hypothetical protein
MILVPKSLHEILKGCRVCGSHPSERRPMKGPGMRYVRTIFTRNGTFTLTEHRGVPEEVISVEYNPEVGGWYVTVCGHGEAPKDDKP